MMHPVYSEILDSLNREYQKLLGDKLIGIYVHGSIAFGCFHWDQSDIDLIIVVKEDLSYDTKISLLSFLQTLQLPRKGIEISFVLESVCRSFLYPTPFLLHYSNRWIPSFQKDPVQYCKMMQGVDSDLAAHFMVIHKAGIVLYGKPIEEVFGPVPAADYADSILRDIENAREEIEENPIYVILNLCRVIAYFTNGDVLSKQQGGEWALTHLSNFYTPLISEALNCYASGKDMYLDSSSGSLFCSYAMELLHK